MAMTSPTPQATSTTTNTKHEIAIVRPTTSHQTKQLQQLNTALLPVPYPAHFYSAILSDPATNKLTCVAVLLHEQQQQQQQQQRRHSAGDSIHGLVVGGIRCRFEELPVPDVSYEEGTQQQQQQQGPRQQEHLPQQQLQRQEQQQVRRKRIYIQTLAVQPAYRRLGVGTRLLQEVISGVEADDEEVVQVAAHVWVQNEDALEWYQRRGFEMGDQVVEGYYRRLRPGGARFVWRDL
ncbi:MAG: hypothetical protein M1816_006501 [Peltula sp. TS41687]|nr:MAG: hypothetical protein M1816_006501 [Peltula sp. TS41687]